MKTYRQLEIQQYTDLSAYSGIRVGGEAVYFYEMTTESELPILISFAKENNLQVVPIGSGTNTFYGPGKLNILAIKNDLKGVEVISDSDEGVVVKAAAGEDWNDFVDYTVDQGYSGIEALTAVPGTVGASPVQNVGCYGQEVANVIESVLLFDVEKNIYLTFLNKDCEFTYRSSIFKKNPGRYVIIAVTFNLKKESHPGIPGYKVAEDYFTEKGITNPSLSEIRDGITEIRWSKLPRPEILPNCGSWFKNPIINKSDYDSNESVQECMAWPMGDDLVKLSAGWLVEQTVGKNYEDQYFATYGKNALILVNHSLTASPKKLLKFEADIVGKVFDKFGITLEREPILIQ